MKQDFPHGLILNIEKNDGEIQKNVIIPIQAIDKQKMCAKTQNMENIFLSR
jgi:hypothetical protein